MGEYVGELHRVTDTGEVPRCDSYIFLRITQSHRHGTYAPLWLAYFWCVIYERVCGWITQSHRHGTYAPVWLVYFCANYTESQTREICPAVTCIFLLCVIYGRACEWITQSHRHGWYALLRLVCSAETYIHASYSMSRTEIDRVLWLCLNCGTRTRDQRLLIVKGIAVYREYPSDLIGRFSVQAAKLSLWCKLSRQL